MTWLAHPMNSRFCLSFSLGEESLGSKKAPGTRNCEPRNRVLGPFVQPLCSLACDVANDCSALLHVVRSVLPTRWPRSIIVVLSVEVIGRVASSFTTTQKTTAVTS